MLARVAIARSFFRDLKGNPYMWRCCHENLALGLQGHAVFVCRDEAERDELVGLFRSLPENVRPFWEAEIERILHANGIVFPDWVKPATKGLDLDSLDSLRAWRGYLDVLFVDPDLADEFNFDPENPSDVDPVSGIQVCAYTSRSPRIESYRCWNDSYHPGGVLDKRQIWQLYIEPLARNATEIVMVDPYSIYHVEGTSWLWRLISELPAPADGRTLRLISKKATKRRDRPDPASIEEEARRCLKRYCGPTGLRSAELLTVDESAWKGRKIGDYDIERRRHDRTIRFDDRIIAISSGIEFFVNPKKIGATLSVRFAGDPSRRDFAYYAREEDHLVAAAAVGLRTSWGGRN